MCQALTRATMTALQKTDGGVRGIATGTSFRRLVAKSLARQFGQEVERVCSPFQFALSTRAGVDCVGHAVRIATDSDPRAILLSRWHWSIRPRAPQCHVGQVCWKRRISAACCPSCGWCILNHPGTIGKTVVARKFVSMKEVSKGIL